MGHDAAGGRSAAEIVDAVGATGLLQPGVRSLVMASAGRDSGCLVELAARVLGAGAVHVLHVDHGLRGGADAQADAATVREWCGALGVALTVRAVDPGVGHVGNVHAWARAERRRLAAQVAGEVGARRTLVAHTRTDLVETALGRLATQPGRRALLSMRASEGQLARPLLAAMVTREETAAYCVERGISWREDPSNTDRVYARARIRHDVLPVLRSLNPQAEDAIARTLAELAEES
ncbi:MAG: tRNA lysidine(34) synthetase TilS, partial [Solirubrobacteraceae bacterium]|nr:tRNA lysidine(34) synthetase TilS [Solirubrobacteraceae bacterium]